jgi:heme exporter protein A
MELSPEAAQPNTDVPVVRGSGVYKAYGDAGVLTGLNLEVPRGETVTIFGPNGAGKTTLLGVLGSLTRPDRGEVAINGFSLKEQAALARSTMGVVMHSSLLYGDLTARENLRFYGKLFSLGDAEDRIETLAKRLNVAHRLDDKVRDLSHGLEKRVSFVRALLHRPRLLLLDEPESGLDQNTLGIFEDLLAEFRAAGGATVLVTHSLERGLALSDRIAILSGGRIVFDDRSENVTIEELSAIYRRFTGDVS